MIVQIRLENRGNGPNFETSTSFDLYVNGERVGLYLGPGEVRRYAAAAVEILMRDMTGHPVP